MRPEEFAEAMHLLRRIVDNVDCMRQDMRDVKRSLDACDVMVAAARLDLAAMSRTACRMATMLDRIDSRFDAIERRVGGAGLLPTGLLPADSDR